MKSTHGGKRAGAGKPKGHQSRETLAKAQAREVARGLITAQLQPLIEAQIANALGIKYLVVREKKTGKFVRVTEAMARAREKVKDSEELIEVWEKDASVQAFTDLMNRAIDKPKEQEQALNITASVDIVRILRERQARHAHRD